MGTLLAKLRKKKTTYEVLEDIDKKLKNLEQFNRVNQERRKKFISRLVLYSILVYILCAVALYFFLLPEETQYRIYGSVPFLCFPILVYISKRVLHWYFVRKITKNELEMQDLKSQRKEILENVMETETYKKAKEILEKFDPETQKKLENEKKVKEEAERLANLPQTAKAGLRQRVNMPTPRNNGPMPINPATIAGTSRMNTPMPMGNSNTGQPTSPRLPRPILPATPSTMDKVLNYLIGDGVDQRFALICKNCYSHNGMAMKEEYEYLAFRCAYCRFFNPSRKQRPNAPRLPDVLPSPRQQVNVQLDNKNQEPGNKDQTDASDKDSATGSMQSSPRSRKSSNDCSPSEPKKLEFPIVDDSNEVKVLDEDEIKEENISSNEAMEIDDGENVNLLSSNHVHEVKTEG